MSGSLPGPEFWALIRPHTGDVDHVRRTPRGFSSDMTAVVECEKGPFFVKTVRNRPGGRRDSIVREELINPFVTPVSPALRWKAEDDAWTALGFEVIDARSSDFVPASRDLPAIVGVLNRIAELPLPPIAREWRETRWHRFADAPESAALFEGDALLHTDVNPSNLMIYGRNTWAVDWAWPTRGAAFIDPALLVLQLVAAGHTADSAESWAAHCPAWAAARPQAIDAFAVANLRMYQQFAERKPDAAWLGAMAAAARSWVAHRGVAVAGRAPSHPATRRGAL